MSLKKKKKKLCMFSECASETQVRFKLIYTMACLYYSESCLYFCAIIDRHCLVVSVILTKIVLDISPDYQSQSFSSK